MAKLLCFLLTILVLALADKKELFEPLPKPIVTQSQGGFRSSIGTVYQAKQCGGAGKFLEWRLEGCETQDSPCQLPTSDGLVRRAEMDYAPSRDIPQLGLRITILMDGKHAPVVFEQTIEDSAVTGGVKSTITDFGRIGEELKGKRIVAKHELYNIMDLKVDVCAEAEFEFY